MCGGKPGILPDWMRLRSVDLPHPFAAHQSVHPRRQELETRGSVQQRLAGQRRACGVADILERHTVHHNVVRLVRPTSQSTATPAAAPPLARVVLQRVRPSRRVTIRVVKRLQLSIHHRIESRRCLQSRHVFYDLGVWQVGVAMDTILCLILGGYKWVCKVYSRLCSETCHPLCSEAFFPRQF